MACCEKRRKIAGLRERARAPRGGLALCYCFACDKQRVGESGKKSHVEGIFSFFFCCGRILFCRTRAHNDGLRQLFLRVFPEMLRRRRRWGRDLPFYVWYCPFLHSVAVGTFLGLHAAQFFGGGQSFWEVFKSVLCVTNVFAGLTVGLFGVKAA